MADFAELAALIMLLAAAGAVVGATMGALGVGGGVALTPALFGVFEALGYDSALSARIAVASALGAIALLSARALLAHVRAGAVDWALLKAWAAWLGVGVAAAVVAAEHLPASALLAVYGLAAFVIAVQIALDAAGASRPVALAEAPPTGGLRAGWGAALGGLAGLSGLGGGTLAAPVLRLHGMEKRAAIAASAGFGVLIGGVGALGYAVAGIGTLEKPPLTLGYLNLPAIGVVALAAVFAAPAGALLAQKLKAKLLRLAIAAVLAIAALTLLRKAGLA